MASRRTKTANSGMPKTDIFYTIILLIIHEDRSSVLSEIRFFKKGAKQIEPRKSANPSNRSEMRFEIALFNL